MQHTSKVAENLAELQQHIDVGTAPAQPPQADSAQLSAEPADAERQTKANDVLYYIVYAQTYLYNHRPHFVKVFLTRRSVDIVGPRCPANVEVAGI